MNILDIISHFTQWHWYFIIWLTSNVVVYKRYLKNDSEASVLDWGMQFDSTFVAIMAFLFMLPFLLVYEFLRIAIESFKNLEYLMGLLLLFLQSLLWTLIGYIFMVSIEMKPLPIQEGVIYGTDKRIVIQLVSTGKVTVSVPTIHYYAEVETSTMRVEIGINSDYYNSNPVGQHVNVCGYVSALGTQEYGWCK